MPNGRRTQIKCCECAQRLPRDSFEWLPDKNGRLAPRKQCRVCSGVSGFKQCKQCLTVKPVDNFKSGKSNGRKFYGRCCWSCIVQQRQERGTLQYPKKKKPSLGIGPGRPRRGPGWMPPPTREQLALLHSRYLPPPGWSPPPGELPDMEYEQDDNEEEVSECA